MPQCSAINCANRPEKGFNLFRFPAEQSRRQKWIEYCGRKDFVPTKNSTLCQLHFAADQFKSDPTRERKIRLKCDAVPSVVVQPRSNFTASRGRKKCLLSAEIQDGTTEESKESKLKESTKSKARNINALVKKTKRWAHVPKVEWSYDHPYSKRRRIYFEIVESRVLTGKCDDQKLEGFSPIVPQESFEKRLFADLLKDKVECVASVGGKLCKDVESLSNLSMGELRDAIQDTVQTKMELRRQLTALKNADQGGCARNVEAFCNERPDDLQVLDLYMTVDEVNDGSVAEAGEPDGCSDAEMEARTGLMKRLEDLELLEKTLRMRLAQIMQTQEVSLERSSSAVDEMCPTATVEVKECVESGGIWEFPRENPIVRVVESVVGFPSVDSKGAEIRSPDLSSMPAVETGPTISSTSVFVCESCGKIFASVGQLHSHQRLHLDKKRKPRTCHICRKSFLLLGRHLRTHSGERPYRCLDCGRQFSRLDNLQNHIRGHAIRARRRYACDGCGAEFPNRYDLRAHQKTHRTETLYSCIHCDRQFLYRNVWKSHVKSHLRKKQFLCNVCGKQFVMENNLNDHIAGVHSDERPHRCRVCGKSFVRAVSLSLHENSHTGNRPHACERCPKRFFSPGSLSAHMRVHYGETPYVCTVCWKCFRYSCHLKIHLRVHSGEKPYQCSICCKHFAQNGNLKEHLRIHSQSSELEET